MNAERSLKAAKRRHCPSAGEFDAVLSEIVPMEHFAASSDFAGASAGAFYFLFAALQKERARRGLSGKSFKF
ncbi:MAG: hypothetical protein P4L75_02165 [Clostridia bacterium]|nr:hypothetical protein [Clostridia bacterium]MDR3644700.1 hypothetical protein [Clostridia bacterium]